MHDLKKLGDRALEVQIRSVKKDLERYSPDDTNEDQVKQRGVLVSYLADCERELASRKGEAVPEPEEVPAKKKRAPAKKKDAPAPAAAETVQQPEAPAAADSHPQVQA